MLNFERTIDLLIDGQDSHYYPSRNLQFILFVLLRSPSNRENEARGITENNRTPESPEIIICMRIQEVRLSEDLGHVGDNSGTSQRK